MKRHDPLPPAWASDSVRAGGDAPSSEERRKAAKRGSRTVAEPELDSANFAHLPKVGEFVELKWTVTQETRGQWGSARSTVSKEEVWWPAVVLTYGFEDAVNTWRVCYTKDPRPANALTALSVDTRNEETASEVPREYEVVFGLSPNVAVHTEYCELVAAPWRFADVNKWKSQSTAGATPCPPRASLDYPDNGPAPVELAQLRAVQEEYAREHAREHARVLSEVSALRTTVLGLEAAAAEGSALRKEAAAQELSLKAVRTLETYVRGRVEESLAGSGSPQAMDAWRTAVGAADGVVVGKKLTTASTDCTLEEFSAMYSRARHVCASNAERRLSAFPNGRRLSHPDNGEPGPLHVQLFSYRDLCELIGIPERLRVLRAGKRKDGVSTVVGTTLTQPGAGASSMPSQRIIVGHSCFRLFGGRAQTRFATLGESEHSPMKVYSLLQEDTTYDATDARSSSVFVGEENDVASLAQMRRMVSSGVEYDAADITFDLVWSPLPIPPGFGSYAQRCKRGREFFEKGQVPGTVVVQIPVVLVKTPQLSESVERELLGGEGAEDEFAEGPNQTRATLRAKILCEGRPEESGLAQTS